MKIIQYTDVKPVIFDSGTAKGIAGRVVIGKNDGAENFCMRIFEVSASGCSPRHSHEWEHEIFIHSGMNMGILPVTGLPFPLVSAGGSSLLATMMGLGIAVGAYKK